ncbi:MAG TPA: cobalt-precorrin-6A reductase [Acetobacteraceae bacterium]|nr:cobalt-precorrin-6A reductase [Acetobacteraceae bacterium]
MQRINLLILGGTAEASALARALAGRAGQFDATLSFAGRTQNPVLPPIPCRIGGFGGAAGLAAYLREQAVDVLVDATHPFAARISASAVEAACAAGIPLLAIRRPPWVAGPGDRWQPVASMTDAAAALGPVPRRVLLTIGRQDLAPFVAAPWHRYLIRSVDAPPPELQPPGAEVLTARGPFDAAGERDLLTRHGIEVLVTKNAGGDATIAKLHAARALGLTVVMVERPALPDGAVESVPDAQAALEWLLRRPRALPLDPAKGKPLESFT